jgi:hypothetical protein
MNTATASQDQIDRAHEATVENHPELEGVAFDVFFYETLADIMLTDAAQDRADAALRAA